MPRVAVSSIAAEQVMNKQNWLIGGGVILLAAIFLIIRTPPATDTATQGPLITIIAGENFWGSLISQLGGNKVSVTSIVSDPNADPHEYESNAGDARAVSNADYVIENGAGYDSSGSQLTDRRWIYEYDAWAEAAALTGT